MLERDYFVYIVTNKKHGVIYIGVTNSLDRRMSEHKQKLIKGFTKKYNLSRLVYYEVYNDISDAISREKQLKKWNRNWKIRLIEKEDKEWEDLSGFDC